ncbi:hypothetical protein [Blastococcus deserti]|uniref:Integral membrane protein n=1 Tax=Blastococcus deserti TaxID=2259033 RepID=A0ABW4XD53_9ACTN
MALLVLAAVVALGTLVTAWAPSLGDGRSQVCRDRGVPYTPPDENWHTEATASWLPLGLACTWTDPATGDVLRQEPSWTPTLVIGVSVCLGLVGVTAVGRSRLGRDVAAHRSN